MASPNSAWRGARLASPEAGPGLTPSPGATPVRGCRGARTPGLSGDPMKQSGSHLPPPVCILSSALGLLQCLH